MRLSFTPISHWNTDIRPMSKVSNVERGHLFRNARYGNVGCAGGVIGKDSEWELTVSSKNSSWVPYIIIRVKTLWKGINTRLHPTTAIGEIVGIVSEYHYHPQNIVNTIFASQRINLFLQSLYVSALNSIQKVDKTKNKINTSDSQKYAWVKSVCIYKYIRKQWDSVKPYLTRR